MAMQTVLRKSLGTLMPMILSPNRSWATQRRIVKMVLRANPLARGVSRHAGPLPGGLPGETFCRAGDTPDSADTALLYLHGGGYCVGAAATHRMITSRLAAASGMPVHVLDYRLAPEHPAPAALDDALACYRALAAQGKRVAVGGDSAGGGLSMAVAHALAANGEQAPLALALLSPWLDLSVSGGSAERLAAIDPILTHPWISACAEAYAGGKPLKSPDISPLFADAELPPTLIHAGSDDILIDDARRLVTRHKAVEFKVYEGLWHVFQLQAGLLGESSAALHEMGTWLHQRALEAGH